MTFQIPSLKDLDVEGKRVIVRAGFDVPLDDEGNVKDDKRIRETLPTLKHLIDKKAKVIVISHNGRPKGQIVDKLKMDKTAKRLSELLNQEVKKLDDIVSEKVKERVKKMEPGEVVVLENLRFNPNEKEKDDIKREEFARQLAELGDVYVNEAFAVSHRNHASMTGIPKFIPGYAGFCLQKELDVLQRTMKNPERPFVAILGGAKGDKIKALKSLVKKADKILVGGTLASMLLKIKGFETGDSKIDKEVLEEFEDDLREILGEEEEKIVLPKDFVVANRFEEDAESKVVPADKIEKGWMNLDIGPETVEMFKEILRNAKTVVWAGPLGVFEWERFSNGTREIAKFLADSDLTSIIGGGESGEAIEKFGLVDRMTHVSTGGGAFMTFVTKEELPAVNALIQSKISEV
jgi:phosphoglycerate kinase